MTSNQIHLVVAKTSGKYNIRYMRENKISMHYMQRNAAYTHSQQDGNNETYKRVVIGKGLTDTKH